MLAARSQAEVGTGRRRTSESRGIIDLVAERKRRHHADAGNRHKTSGGFVFPCELADPPIKPVQFATHIRMNGDKRQQHRPKDMPDEVVHAIKWQTASRYMMVEAFAQIDTEEIDPILSITTEAA